MYSVAAAVSHGEGPNRLILCYRCCCGLSCAATRRTPSRSQAMPCSALRAPAALQWCERLLPAQPWMGIRIWAYWQSIWPPRLQCGRPKSRAWHSSQSATPLQPQEPLGKAHWLLSVAARHATWSTPGEWGGRNPWWEHACRYWAEQIAGHGMIGLVLSQSPEYVAPHGSSEAIFGTNPIAVGIPAAEGPLIMDLATSASSWWLALPSESCLHARALEVLKGLETPPPTAHAPHQVWTSGCRGERGLSSRGCGL